MKSTVKEKRVYGVLWTLLLISTVCEQSHSIGHISFASNRTGNFDIYLIDTNGENLRSLTNHPADERAPTWSPDGRFLAYTSNRDGDLRFHWRIYIMDTKTREHWRLTDRHEEEWFPAWSPDGKSIAFVSIDHEGPWKEDPRHRHRSDIYKIDVNGTNLRQLTHRGKNGRPAWSPDSQWIAFVSSHRGEGKGIYVMNAHGKKLRRLNDKGVQMVHGIFQSECSWAPDGKRIGFSISVPKVKRMHLCMIDVDGKNFRQLTQGRAILRPMNLVVPPFIQVWLPEISLPAWSPDGDWIAYVFSGLPLSGTADIYIVDAEGKGRGRPLVKEFGQDLSPTWVPETFFSVSPSAEKQTTLWGRLKQP